MDVVILVLLIFVRNFHFKEQNIKMLKPPPQHHVVVKLVYNKGMTISLPFQYFIYISFNCTIFFFLNTKLLLTFTAPLLMDIIVLDINTYYNYVSMYNVHF